MSTDTVRKPDEGEMGAAPHGLDADPWLATGLLMLGLGAGLVAILGPLGLGVIEYHTSAAAANQIAGGDVASLLIVAPLSLVAAALVARGRRAGALLALGPAAYAAYTYTQLALGGDVARYDGNSESFFALFLGLFLSAALIAVRAWPDVARGPAPPRSARTDRAMGWFALLVAAFLALGLHLPGLLDVWSGHPSAPEYLADPAVFWLVKWMDLGLVVPALVAVGVGLIRGASWAQRLKHAAAAWMALLGTAVAGMAVVMQATHDPAASVGNTVAFVGFAVIAWAIAGLVFRGVLHEAS